MPRKTVRLAARPATVNRASMRPRPDAAENFLHPLHQSGRAAASMRPRPDAAENVVGLPDGTCLDGLQ